MSQFVQRENTAPQQNWDSLIAHSSAVADRYSKRNATAARVANQLQANMIALGQKGKATVNASTGRVEMDKDFMDNFVAKKDENLSKQQSVTSDTKIIDDPEQQKALAEYTKNASTSEDRAKKVNEFYQGIADGTKTFPGQNLGRNGQLNNQVQDPAKQTIPAPTGNTFIGTGAIDPAIKAAASAIASGQKPDTTALSAVPQLAGTPDPNATSPEAVAKLAQATGKNVSVKENNKLAEGASTGASLTMDASNKNTLELAPTVANITTVNKGVHDSTQMSLGQLSKLKNFAQIMGSTDGTPMPNVSTQWDELIVQRGNELKAAQAALEPTVTTDIKQGGIKTTTDNSFKGVVDTQDKRNISTTTIGGTSIGNTSTGGATTNGKRLNFQGVDGTYSLNTTVQNGQTYAEPVTNAKFGTKMMDGKHYLSGDKFKAVTKQMELSTTGKKYGYSFKDDGTGNMQIFKQGKLIGAYNGWRQLDTYEQVPLSEFQFLAGGSQQTGSDANDE